MSDLRKQKSDLRKQVLSQRQELDTKAWQEKSEKITEKVRQLNEFRNANAVHCYVSMNDRNEVATDSLIDDVLKSGRQLIVPVTNFEDGTLTHSLLPAKNILKKNEWGVKEPAKINEFAISNLDIILIPMAAADRNGNRLGYGKGFYDRFLKESRAFKVGMIFHEFLFDEIPTESFDEKLDAIITDREVIFP